MPCSEHLEGLNTILLISLQVGKLHEQLHATMNPELSEHVLQMCLDGLVANAEPLAYFFVSHATSQRADDLLFPLGQGAR
jgi:hypothetical protein